MQRKRIQIRDMQIIDKEMSTNPVGVLAFSGNNESIVQLPTTFVYLDKNVYIFFDENNEALEKIQYDADVHFTITRYEKIKKTKKGDFIPAYKLTSVIITGRLKRLDDSMNINRIQNIYIEKYSPKTMSEVTSLNALQKIFVIDSEELQAYEEIGG
jgi:nitroimidazol reductase NimA-like FMN-containing flavoprotein (pyridoxamine 5'-phosphate oxidase superfamily)